MMRAMQDSFHKAHLTDISFVFINSFNSTDGFESLATTAGNVTVYQDNQTNSTWNHLQGGKDDIFVFDKCGKLAFYLPYPLSLVNEPYLRAALLSAYHDSPCGPCQPVQTEPQLITNCTLNPADNTTKLCHVDVIYPTQGDVSSNSTNHLMEKDTTLKSNDINSIAHNLIGDNTNSSTDDIEEDQLPISVLQFEVYNKKATEEITNNSKSESKFMALLQQVSRNDLGIDKLDRDEIKRNQTFDINIESMEDNLNEIAEKVNMTYKEQAQIFRQLLCYMPKIQNALEHLYQWFHKRSAPWKLEVDISTNHTEVNQDEINNDEQQNLDTKIIEVIHENNTDRIREQKHHAQRHHHELPRGKHGKHHDKTKEKNIVKKVRVPDSNNDQQAQVGYDTVTEHLDNVGNGERRNEDMLTSCPDFNRRRCEQMTSKFLRARHCCHIISKSDIKGEEVVPMKCRGMNAEKCIKLRAYHKCCQEDGKVYNLIDEQIIVKEDNQTDNQQTDKVKVNESATEINNENNPKL